MIEVTWLGFKVWWVRRQRQAQDRRRFVVVRYALPSCLWNLLRGYYG